MNYKIGNNTLYNGDCLDVLKTLSDNSVDSIVTDPPAGISFQGAKWDEDKGGRDCWIKWMEEIASECLRVIKPGGHALVWSLPRTQHWTATAWENGGFEVRDTITHLFGSGFPKSQNIGKAIDKQLGLVREIGVIDPMRAGKLKNQLVNYSTNSNWTCGNRKITIDLPVSEQAKKFEGYGTHLKPATENWILLRKPLSENTIAENVMLHGTGGLNIDGCRVKFSDKDDTRIGKNYTHNAKAGYEEDKDNSDGNNISLYKAEGRFPANFIHSGEEEVMEEFKIYGNSKSVKGKQRAASINNETRLNNSKETQVNCEYSGEGDVGRFFKCCPVDEEDYSSFYYCAKPSTKERNEGVITKNNHPTIKVISLMSYLCRLVTPKDGIVLDPFMGSGSTGRGAIQEGFNFIGIEKEADYFEIAKARVKYQYDKSNPIPNTFFED